nr:MAG TPA: hypothetical protein [Caudoviricetes sp.]
MTFKDFRSWLNDRSLPLDNDLVIHINGEDYRISNPDIRRREDGDALLFFNKVEPLSNTHKEPETITVENEPLDFRLLEPQTNINIHANNSTVNIYNGRSSKKDKQNKIDDNLQQLAALGLDYERLSNYAVRIHTLQQDIDFFLTTERFMPVGGTIKGQGIPALVKYIESL